MLDSGPDQPLASLMSYPGLRDTCGIIFAQAAALCASLSIALQCQLQQRRQQQQGPLVGLVQAGAQTLRLLYSTTAGYCSSTGSRQHHCCWHTPATQGGGVHRTGTAATAAAAAAEPSLLTRWPGVCWSASKRQLLQVLQHETLEYLEAVAAADRSAPFKLDPARSMTNLMFLSTLTLAVIESAQELQEAGLAVLHGDLPACDAATCSGTACLPSCGSPGGTSSAAAPAPIARNGGSICSSNCSTVGKRRCSSTPIPNAAALSSSSSSTAVLLSVLVCMPAWKRLHRALFMEAPAMVKARRGKEANMFCCFLVVAARQSVFNGC